MTALNTYRVLELAENVSGEYCGKLLADFGADVIKIERPGSGSPTRNMGPFAGGEAGTEKSGLFAYLNTNKKSVALDLSREEGMLALGKLLDHVDVVIDDHRSGWLGDVGLDPVSFQDKRPGVVLCSITAFGQNPPEDRQNAEDLTVFHSSGWGYHTPGGGYDQRPPLKGPGRFLVSYEAGMEAAMYVASALYEREESKKGQFIDVSMHEVMASRADYVLAQFVAGEMDVSASRNAFDLFGPAGIFPCRDGFIYVFMATPQHWEGYKQLVGHPDWAKDLPSDWLMKGLTPERIANCRRDLCEWLKSKSKDEAAAEAQALGITLVPVNTPKDLLASPQYQHREYFTEVNHPVQGTALYPTVPYRMSETPAQITSPAPLLGQHSDEPMASVSGGEK
ncbi:CaiB/BaiF CoA transferase family protein [Emcibacter nanhaiensis]|uniref:CoA transferase n=1 Tax=Emcibacter nanhaiensis TaxID=1505037 RepID=A0A501PIL7_9PROT|nr:CoA transferase [Emcibacter nanhaiensis]TPD59898.1 CoA transferase [Emcibacter nanhaiensis]